MFTYDADAGQEEQEDSLWVISLGDFTIEDRFLYGEETWQRQKIETNEEVQGLSEGLDQIISNYSQAHVRSYGIGSSASIGLRGTSAAHTQVYWNGMNINSPTHGQSDISLIPAFFFDEMELSHSSSSLTQGAGGIGGNIRLQNKNISRDGWNMRYNQSYGSYNNHKNRLKASYGNGKVQGRVRLYRHTAENNFEYQNITRHGEPTEQLENASMAQHGAMAETSININENSNISGNFWFFDSNRELPRPMTVRNNDEEQADRSYRSVVNYEYHDDNRRFTAVSGYINDYLLYENRLSDIYSETFVSRWFNRADYLHSSGDWDFGGGINAELNEASTEGYPDGVRRDLVSGHARTGYHFDENMNIGLVVRQELNSSELSPVLPGASFTWRFLDRKATITLNMQASRNYRLPSLNDLYWKPGGNPDLGPEISEQAETGVTYRQSILNGNLQLKNRLNVFYNDVENRIVWEPGVTGNWEAKNFKKVNSRGVENHLTARFSVNSVTSGFRAVYGYTEATTQADGNQLIYMPFHTLRTSLFSEWQDWQISLTSTYTGKQYLNTGNTRYLPGYELLHAGLSKGFALYGIQFRGGANVRNITNKNYQTIAHRPMPGRHFEFFLSLNLGSDQ